jgi:predicted enzyme related to lactoylglutathione lyase
MLQSHPMYAYIPARDITRARRFYEEKVGLKGEEIEGGVAYKFPTRSAASP